MSNFDDLIECQAFICDFHHLQAWERRFNKKSNGSSDRKGDIIPKLRRIARSKNSKDMEHAVADFKDSDFGSQENFPQLSNYLNKYWFSITEVRQSFLRFS